MTGQFLTGMSAEGNRIVFVPGQPFQPGEVVNVSATQGLQYANGTPLDTSLTWQVRVLPAATGTGGFTSAQVHSATAAQVGRFDTDIWAG